MKKLFFVLIFGIMIFLESCSNPSKPNYQYFPNMYESVGYETYSKSDAFSNGIEAQTPVNKSIARGWTPYDYLDTNEGYEEAKINLKSPIEITKENLSKGKELYGIYCAVCHLSLIHI